MQRGVITIDPEFVKIIQAQTAEIAEHHPHTWQKLSDAAAQQQPTALELSKEEVEMILDIMPPPTMEDPESLKHARRMMQELLLSLAG